MSKAEEIHYKAVMAADNQEPPKDYVISAHADHFNGFVEGYVEGYHQAEKDLELTIEDIERIHTFLYAIKHNKQGVFTFTRLSDEQYQKILKRYKDYKERKEKCQ